MSKELESRIKDILINLPSTKVEGLKRLFWEMLNYNPDNVSVSQANWTEEFSDLFVETPVCFATCAINDGFHILYFHLNTDKLLISTERQVVNKLITDYPFSLFVFSNQHQDRWHFVNAIQNQDKKRSKQFILRRISISKEDRLRTASERIAKLDVSLIEASLFGVSPIQVQKLHEAAFDVEAVTEEFFNEYKSVFTSLMTDLNTQSSDQIWAHDFALQFMNRLMFIYYIERKRWLGDDPDFLHNFWREYLKSSKGSDRFVDEWLNILFFEAFNKKFSAGRSDYQHIPEKYRSALQLAPYLNGGLFSKNELDEKFIIHISDNLIGNILKFLDKYNFTISEDTPLDQEVAVDPEMIGKVYESLVNVSDEVDEQSDAGIFYTPRIEIDLMCRLSLVDWLSNHLTEISKNILYEFVFAFNPEEKQNADRAITELGLWPELEELLSGITVLDPACGSGSFLVGILGILDDLLVRSNSQLGKEETSYERRKRIIGASLYGVDIMDWAVHVAELRLWLQLVIETDLDLGERTCQALLPSLSFKLRQGDSLVQEVGGLNLSLHRQGGQLNRSTVNQLKSLKEEKFKYFQNDPDRKYRTKAELSRAEFLLFEEVIADQIRALEARKFELVTMLKPGENLFGEVQPRQMDLESPKRAQELELVERNMESLRSARHVLHTQKAIPFVWDVAFVEIFEGEKQGFDIVIGNPPYTRQEEIRDLKLPEELSKLPANKKAYKAKIATAVYNSWPKTFGFNSGKGEASWKLNKKSDLYIYFYFIGLSLLNPRGSFCFITSNSWLDVGYGSDLQQFILTHSEMKFVVDNQVKRSFKNADVNTIIILLRTPYDKQADLDTSLNAKARFVVFKVPFEEVLSPVFWEELESVTTKKDTGEYRAMIKSQSDLLASGKDCETDKYIGDKWGGKYLRAPDIYWYILEKCKDKLVTLESVADVRFGIKTGANDFFYLDEERINSLGIEEEYLVSAIYSLKEIRRIEDDLSGSKLKMLRCSVSKPELKGTKVLEYILWGESNSYHLRPSCKSRKLWYSVADGWKPAPFIFPAKIGERFLVLNNKANYLEDKKLYGITPRNGDEFYWSIVLNSTFTLFDINLNCRQLTGAQAIADVDVAVANKLLLIRPELLDLTLFEEVYEEFSKREINPHITEELKNQDRNHIDEQIAFALGLAKSDVSDVYEATMKIIEDRLLKAKSV